MSKLSGYNSDVAMVFPVNKNEISVVDYNTWNEH